MSKPLEVFDSQQLSEILIVSLAFCSIEKRLRRTFQRCKKLRKILRTQKVTCGGKHSLEFAFVPARGLNIIEQTNKRPDTLGFQRSVDHQRPTPRPLPEDDQNSRAQKSTLCPMIDVNAGLWTALRDPLPPARRSWQGRWKTQVAPSPS